jgi:hypothetical protein
MVEIKDNVIIYKVAINGDLGLISPYLFIERLADAIVEAFPQIKVNKLFASRMEAFHQIQCNAPKHYSKERILELGKQIELIANNLFEGLQEKIYFARLAG